MLLCISIATHIAYIHAGWTDQSSPVRHTRLCDFHINLKRKRLVVTGNTSLKTAWKAIYSSFFLCEISSIVYVWLTTCPFSVQT